VDTEWIDGGVAVRQTNFAYPLESETIKSGVEPPVDPASIERSFGEG
jgi:hypothetical protein